MNSTHRHVSAATLEPAGAGRGQKRKLAPRAESMLMISPSSDSNLMTAYKKFPSQAASNASISNTSTLNTIAIANSAVPSASMAALTPIQPSPSLHLSTSHDARHHGDHTAVANVPDVAVPASQHAAVLKTSMVASFSASRPVATTMPATMALARANVSAMEASAGSRTDLQSVKTTTMVSSQGKSNGMSSTVHLIEKVIASTSGNTDRNLTAADRMSSCRSAVMSPVEFAKESFRDWGISIEATRDAPYFLKATPDRIAAYSRDILATVRQKDMAKLRQLHENGKIRNACNPFGESLLHLACRKGLTDVVRFLCGDETGPRLSLFVHDDYGRTVMHDACWTVRPQWELIEFLMEHAPELLACADVRGHIPLDYVPKADWKQWIDFLLPRKEKIKSWMTKRPKPSQDSPTATNTITKLDAAGPTHAPSLTAGITESSNSDHSLQSQQELELHNSLQDAVSKAASDCGNPRSASIQAEGLSGSAVTSTTVSASASSNTSLENLVATTTAPQTSEDIRQDRLIESSAEGASSQSNATLGLSCSTASDGSERQPDRIMG